jgi:hypothetical protein
MAPFKGWSRRSRPGGHFTRQATPCQLHWRDDQAAAEHASDSVLLLIATTLEVSDAVVRMAIHSHSGPARAGLFTAGAILLFGYGSTCSSFGRWSISSRATHWLQRRLQTRVLISAMARSADK